jgi:hypothetical protein
MYDPTVGRFITEDPSEFEGGDYNLYRYCGNDPMDLTDPTGLCSGSGSTGSYWLNNTPTGSRYGLTPGTRDYMIATNPGVRTGASYGFASPSVGMSSIPTVSSLVSSIAAAAGNVIAGMVSTASTAVSLLGSLSGAMQNVGPIVSSQSVSPSASPAQDDFYTQISSSGFYVPYTAAQTPSVNLSGQLQPMPIAPGQTDIGSGVWLSNGAFCTSSGTVGTVDANGHFIPDEDIYFPTEPSVQTDLAMASITYAGIAAAYNAPTIGAAVWGFGKGAAKEAVDYLFQDYTGLPLPISYAVRPGRKPLRVPGEPVTHVPVSGPYSHLPDSASVGPGKPFTQTQKQKILAENIARNNGVIKSDLSGTQAVQPIRHTHGITPPNNEAQIDHIVSRSKGGTNSYSNAQVLTRKENLKKKVN